MSKSLGQSMHYRILLPASYEGSTRSYPVLYLLHGLYGDYKNWTDKTSVAKYLSGVDLIVVMPDADDSWYTNSVTDRTQKYEDYLIKDLISEIESHYRTINNRDSRWVAGLSMGGYGAIKFGLKYPKMFSVVGSFSGALTAPTTLHLEYPAFETQLENVFGPKGSPARADNDPYQMIKADDPKSLPYFYLTCGTQDKLLTDNRNFVAPLPSLKITYQYHEFPGGHEWPFWDRSIRDFLHTFEPMLTR